MMNMQAGIPKAQLMAGDAMNRALTRMAHEMMEQLMPLENVVLVGIRRRGVPLAQRLSDIIEKYRACAHSGGRSGYCHVPRRPRSGTAER